MIPGVCSFVSFSFVSYMEFDIIRASVYIEFDIGYFPHWRGIYIYTLYIHCIYS